MWKVITSAPLLAFPEGKKEEVTMDIAAVMDSHCLETLRGQWSYQTSIGPQYPRLNAAETSKGLGSCLTRQSVGLNFD